MKYWKFAPGSHGCLWVEQRESNCIALGWNELEDLDKYRDDNAIKNRFNELKKSIYKSSSSKQLITFLRETSTGDKVIASSGKYIYGIGTITGEYVYNDDLVYKHSKPVKWEVTFWDPLNISDSNLSSDTKKRLIKRIITILELEENEYNEIESLISENDSPFKNMTNWEGLLSSPNHEQEVIILFSRLAPYLKMKIIEFSTRFPDAYLKVKNPHNSKWEPKYTEFEKSSSDFVSHGHLKKMEKGKKCDLIICWEDDSKEKWKEKPKEIKIIELKSELLELL